MKGRDRDAALITRAARRLAWQFGLVFAIVLAIVGLVVTVSIDASIRDSFEQQLEAAIESPLPTAYTPGAPIAVVVNGEIRTAHDLPEGLPDLAALQRAAQGEEHVRTTLQHEDHEYLVYTEQEDDIVVQAAVDVHEAAEERGRVTGALALGGAVGVIAAALGAFVLARRAMRPVATALAKQRRFVADASHELRTPLTLLSTRVQLLRRKLTVHDSAVDTNAVAGEIEAIERDTQSLTRLLEELLAAADERPITRERVDVVACAHEVVAAAQAQAEHAGVHLDVTADAAAPALATAQGVRQVLTALLANAIDHAHSRVTLRITSGPRDLTLQVADDGAGFPPGVDVFERFASHRTQTETSHHYGLGLSLVADLVHRLGGSVRTRPDLSGGVIEVTLPRA